MSQNGDTNINDLHKAEPSLAEQAADSNDKKFEELKTQFEQLKNEHDELDDKYKRLWADQQNIVNRFNRERTEIHKYAAFTTLEAILPALDNFDFAKKSLNENTSHSEMIKSIEMLQEQLLMSLRSVGLEEVATNITYNPELHEAISKVKDSSKPEGSIAEVLKKGFKIKDKVLRVATVVVTTRDD